MARPTVIMNMASSVDGKITSARRETPQMTSAYDKKLMDRLRSETDAIVIGAGTLRSDDPPLGVRNPEMQARRLSLHKPPDLLTVVVSRSLGLDPDARFFRQGEPGRRIVATVRQAPEARLAALRDRAQIWQLGDDEVDVRALVARLAQLGVQSLLVEGGGELNWSFVAADLVDEIYWTIAPALVGGRDAPTLLEGQGWAIRDRRRLSLLDVHREGDELYCHYRVERAGAADNLVAQDRRAGGHPYFIA